MNALNEHHSSPVKQWSSKSINGAADGGNGSFGVMIDVMAKKAIVITSLGFLTDSFDDVKITLYSRIGSYKQAINDESLSAWSLVSTEVATGRGSRMMTPLPDPEKTLRTQFAYPIEIAQGTTRSLYITAVDKTEMRYSSTTLEEGRVFNENSDVALLVGCGIGSYPFVIGSVFHKRIFNGYIHYQTLENSAEIFSSFKSSRSDAFNNNLVQVEDNPRENEVNDEPMMELLPRDVVKVVTQQAISLEGIENNNLMTNDVVRTFENIATTFISKSTGILIDQITVSRDPILNRRMLQVQPTNRFLGAMGTSAISQQITLFTTITGEYNPPPKIDFSKVVGDAFDSNGDVFVRELKEEEPFFRNVKNVDSLPVSFPDPTPGSSKISGNSYQMHESPSIKPIEVNDEVIVEGKPLGVIQVLSGL